VKILSMTATFGKLEGQTLSLQEGLNVITAPNEWGKSTWCAFITAMLYGIETSQRTSAKGLADKERYAPWSGKPMSGRMDILWNGRKITIERSTKGRSVFGVFKAYETDSGLEIPELTGENCGLTLLGVEKNVFTRAGFVRLADMPVTDDLAFRRRLNELVTTGDESGASDKLAQKLKELKNQCRHNKTGLLPQAENQRDAIRTTLSQIEHAQNQIALIGERQEAIRQELAALENHNAHLAYAEAKSSLQKVEAARNAHQETLARARNLEMACADLPAEEFAQKKLSQAEHLQSRWAQFQTKPQPQMPQVPGVAAELSAAQKDKAEYDALQKPLSPVFLILAVLGLAVGIGLFFVNPLLIAVGIALAAVFGYLHFHRQSQRAKALAKLKARYNDLPAERWVTTAATYEEAEAAYQKAAADYCRERTALQEETEALTGGKSLQEVTDSYRKVLSAWKALSDARQDAVTAGEHAEAIAAIVKEVAKPQIEDKLSFTKQETDYRLAELAREERDLQQKSGSFMGQIQTLGSFDALQQQLQKVCQRIEKLEDTYTALTIAQETLTDAANELQRRFAPKIAEAARQIFGRITGGRYDRLTLGQDLTLQVAAGNEDVLHGTQWRSDGTVDQLYLALRLAVAEALTPESPLVLDDALVRFDDTRLAEVMALLKEESKGRQVILFSCQNREENYA